jgi:glucokinase
MGKYVAGIDLGGTNIKVGLLDFEGSVLAKHSIPTQAQGGRDLVIGRLAESVRLVCDRGGFPLEDVAAVGLGVPGTISIEKGMIFTAPNLPGWTEVPVRDLLADQLGMPVVIENDANSAAWGEYWKGAGQGVDSMVMLTLGTGIGGGIILGGELVHGTSDCAAELGHLIIEYDGEVCGCGNRGCLEAYASAPALVKRLQRAIEEGRPSTLAEEVKAGAREKLEETGMFLGVGIVSILHALNPRLVVLSGGMIGAGDMILEPVKETIKQRAFPEIGEAARVVFARLGGDAGFIGAAGQALKRCQL